MECKSEHNRDVQGPDCVAVVEQATVVVVTKRIPLDLDAWKDDVENSFDDDESPVENPITQGWSSSLFARYRNSIGIGTFVTCATIRSKNASQVSELRLNSNFPP